MHHALASAPDHAFAIVAIARARARICPFLMTRFVLFGSVEKKCRL
jgi:hypothetical protein